MNVITKPREKFAVEDREALADTISQAGCK